MALKNASGYLYVVEVEVHSQIRCMADGILELDVKVGPRTFTFEVFDSRHDLRPRWRLEVVPQYREGGTRAPGFAEAFAELQRVAAKWGYVVGSQV